MPKNEDGSEMKLEFAPGCFDNFEGTQEELDELIAQIHTMFESGQMIEDAEPIDLETLMEEDPEYAEKIIGALSEELPEVKRNLQ